MQHKGIQTIICLGATPFPEIHGLIKDTNSVAEKYKVVGILDDNPDTHGTKIEDVEVLGPLDLVAEHPNAMFVHGIGSYQNRLVRYEIVQRLNLPMDRYASLIHPTATIYDSATMGHGCIVYSGCTVFAEAVIDDLVVISPHSCVGARSVVCEGALIAPLVSIIGDVVVGYYAHIGTHCAIGESKQIGPGAQIGVGSVVLRDVPAGVFALGNPPVYLDTVTVPDGLLRRWEERLTQAKRAKPS